MRKSRARRLLILSILALVLTPTLGFLGWLAATDNFGVVDPGQVYRSGQMEGDELARAVRERGVVVVRAFDDRPGLGLARGIVYCAAL